MKQENCLVPKYFGNQFFVSLVGSFLLYALVGMVPCYVVAGFAVS